MAARIGGYALAMCLTLVGVGVGLVGVVIGVSLDAQHPKQFELELAKALLTLATGLILGGAVKVLLDHFQETAKLRDEEQARHERLLADLRGVHDRAERVRLMVSAHRSAKAYGQHMQALIGCQVLLLKIKRTLDVSRTGGASERANEHLKDMLGYLRALQYEYRDHYKEVADCQRYDEAVTTRRFAKAAEFEVAGDHPQQPPASSQYAWTTLDDAQEFPVLDDLTNEGAWYKQYFLEPFHALAAELVERGDRPSLDRDFDAGVNALAETIHSRCQTAVTGNGRARLS